MERIITVNIGSASKKYALFSGKEKIATVYFEKMPDGYEMRISEGSPKKVDAQEYMRAFAQVVDSLTALGYLEGEGSIDGVGVRIVAPGTYFTAHRPISSEYISRMQEAARIAPLHLSEEIEELEYIRTIFPEIPLFGISDSAFHQTKRDEAKEYALPLSYVKEYDIYRFGYHGLSVASVVSLLRNSEQMPRRMIVLHLGSGASATALLDGMSVDTSMGFTPLEGLVMATRAGDLDVGAVLHLMKETNMSADEMRSVLFNASGIAGMSETGADLRPVLEGAKSGDVHAAHILNMYAYRVRKYIGAYSAILGGLDAIVFAGVTGERSGVIRALILEGLEYLGVELDVDVNNGCVETGAIHTANSRVQIYVRETDEAREIMNAVMLLI